MIVRQPPSYSFLSLTEIVAGASTSVVARDRCYRQLGDLLRKEFQADRVVLTGSGTQALQLAISVARRQRYTPVGLPAYTCYDVASAAVGAGTDVVFYDLDALSLSPDAESLGRVLHSGVGAVVIGNLYGFPVDWRSVRAACESTGVMLIEDCAQGLLSPAPGGGRAGDMTVLSFGRGKGWTGGGGGALLARGPAAEWLNAGLDGALANRAVPLASLKVLTKVIAQWALARPSLYWVPSSLPILGLGETVYHPPRPPRGLDATAACVALRHWEPALAELAARRRTALSWDRAWDRVFGQSESPRRCRPLEGFDAAYHRYPVLAGDADQIERICVACRRWGATRAYPRMLPDLGVLAAPAGSVSDFPGARRLADTLLTLPTHRFVKEADQLEALTVMGQCQEEERTRPPLQP